MVLSDTLRRAYLTEQDNRGPVEVEVDSINMVHYLPVSSERQNAIWSSN